MDEADEARQLLAQEKYAEAGKVLDRLLSSNKGNDEFWYLRGIVSLKLKSYDAAQEHLERALSLKRKAEYYRMKGMAHFEIFELEDAKEEFLQSLGLDQSDVVSHFFLAVCYLFLDDPKCDEHILKAQKIDPKKTKQLISNFYTLFFENDPRISDALKRKITERIRAMKS